MTAKFKVGDHVIRNSGHVSGKVIKGHTKDVDYKGYTHNAKPLMYGHVLITVVGFALLILGMVGSASRATWRWFNVAPS
jgi:hypothetical protein